MLKGIHLFLDLGRQDDTSAKLQTGLRVAAARAGAVVLAEYSAAAQVVCCSHMQQPCAQQATTARQALVGVDWLYKSLTQKSLIPVSPEWQPYPGPSIPGFREAAPEISASGFQDMERTVMQFRVMCTGTVHNAQVVPDRTSHVVVADPNNLSQKMHMVKARGLKLHIVNVAWLLDCLKSWRHLPEGPYSDAADQPHPSLNPARADPATTQATRMVAAPAPGYAALSAPPPAPAQPPPPPAPASPAPALAALQSPVPHTAPRQAGGGSGGRQGDCPTAPSAQQQPCVTPAANQHPALAAVAHGGVCAVPVSGATASGSGAGYGRSGNHDTSRAAAVPGGPGAAGTGAAAAGPGAARPGAGAAAAGAGAAAAAGAEQSLIPRLAPPSASRVPAGSLPPPPSPPSIAAPGPTPPAAHPAVSGSLAAADASVACPLASTLCPPAGKAGGAALAHGAAAAGAVPGRCAGPGEGQAAQGSRNQAATPPARLPAASSGAEQACPSGHKEEEEEEEDLTEPMDDDEGEEGGQGHAGVPGPSPPAPPPAPSSALGSPLQRGATAPADHSNPPSLQAHQPAPAAPRLASGPAAAPPRTATGPGSGASSPAPPDQVAVVTAVTQAVAARPAPLPPPPPQPGGGWVSGEGGGGAGVGRGAAAGADGDDGADPEDDDVTEEPEETEELDTQDASSWQAGLCPGYCTPPPSTHALLPAPCSAPLAAAAPEGAIDPPAAAGTTPDVGQQQRPGLATARRDGQSHTGPPPRLPLAAVSPAAEGFSSRAAQAGSPGLTAEATGGGPVRVQQPSPPLPQEHNQAAAAAAPLALTAASRTPGADPSATGATGSDSALGRQTGGAPELAPLHQHPPTPGLAGAPAAAAALRVPQGPEGTGPAEHPPTPPAAGGQPAEHATAQGTPVQTLITTPASRGHAGDPAIAGIHGGSASRPSPSPAPAPAWERSTRHPCPSPATKRCSPATALQGPSCQGAPASTCTPRPTPQGSGTVHRQGAGRRSPGAACSTHPHPHPGGTPCLAAHGSPGLLPATGPAPHHPVTLTPPPLHQAACSQATGGNAHQALLASGGTGGHVRGRGRADLPPVAPQPPSGSFYAAAGLQGQAVGRPSQGSEAALGFAGDEDSIALLTRASTAVHSVSSGPGRWGSATQDEAGWAAAGQLLQQLVPTGLGMGMGRACSSGSSEDAGDQQPAWLAGRPTAQAKAQQCKVAPASVGLAEEAAKQAVQQSGRRNQEQQDQALPQLGPDGCTGDSHSGAVEPAPLDPSSGLHAAAEEALKSGFLVMRPIKRREGRVGSVQAPELKRQAASSTSASEVCCNDVAQPANTAKDAVQKMADSPLPARKRGKQAKVKPSASAAAAKSCNKELQAAAPAAAAELNDVAMPGSILSPTAGTTVDTLPTKPAAPPKKAAIQSSPTAEEAECRASRPSRRRGASGAAQGRCEDPAAPAAEVPAVSSPQGSGDQQRAAEDNLGINMEEDASAATAATVQQAAAKPAVGRGRGRLKMEPAPLLADAQQGASNKAGKRKRPSTGAVAAGAAADEEISATEGAAAAAAGPLHSATAAGAGVNTVASTPTAPPAPQPAGGKTSGRKSARDAKPAPVPAAAPQPAAPTSADPGPAKRRKQQHPEAGSEAGDLPHTAQPQAPIQPAPKLQSPEPGAAGLAAEGGGPCKAKGSGKAAKQKPSSSSTAQRAPIGPPSGLDTEMAEAQPAASSPHKPHPAAQVPAAADTAKPRNSRRQPLPAAQPAAATPITAALSPVGSALPGGAGRSSGKAGAAAAAAAKAAAAVQDATPTAAPTTLPAAPVQVAVAGSAGAAGEETRQPRSSRAQRAQEPAAQPAAPARSSRQSRQAAEGAAAGKGVDAPELCMAGKQADTADAAPGSAASSRPQGRAASRRRQASSGASAAAAAGAVTPTAQPAVPAPGSGRGARSSRAGQPAAVLSEGEQSEGEAEGEEAEEAEAEEVVPSAPRTSSRKGAGSVGGVRAGSAVKGKTAALASAAAAKGQHASTPGARATCLDGPAPVQRASRGRDNGKAAGAGKVTPGGAGSGAVAGEPGEAVQGPGSMVVAFSGMSSEERKQAAGALKRIRIRCLQGPSWEPCVTAILLPAMKRTDKVICGLAAGNWLLDSTRYLKACTSASSWVPPAAYEHQGGHEPQGQGEPGGRLEPGAAPHWRQHRVSTGSGAFAGLRVVLLGSLPPPLDRAAVQLMLQAGGGEVMAVAGTAAALPSLTPLLTGDSKPHLAVVDPAKQQPDRLVAAALEAGVTCVAPAYLVEWVAQPSCCPLPPATYLHGSRPGPELQRLEEDRGLELSAADAQGYMSESL